MNKHIICCQASLDLKDESFQCELPAGHEGAHQESGEAYRNGETVFLWTMTWTKPPKQKGATGQA